MRPDPKDDAMTTEELARQAWNQMPAHAMVDGDYCKKHEWPADVSHDERVLLAEAVREIVESEIPGWARDIIAERKRQNDKWGVQYHDWPTWMAILTEEVGEASQAALHTHFGGRKTLADLREELIHTAAVAVQIIEHIDRTDDVEGAQS